jgi:hypothetical protein
VRLPQARESWRLLQQYSEDRDWTPQHQNQDAVCWRCCSTAYASLGRPSRAFAYRGRHRNPFSSSLIYLRTFPKTVEGSFVASRLRGLSDGRLFVAIRIIATSHIGCKKGREGRVPRPNGTGIPGPFRSLVAHTKSRGNGIRKVFQIAVYLSHESHHDGRVEQCYNLLLLLLSGTLQSSSHRPASLIGLQF